MESKNFKIFFVTIPYSEVFSLAERDFKEMETYSIRRDNRACNSRKSLILPITS